MDGGGAGTLFPAVSVLGGLPATGTPRQGDGAFDAASRAVLGFLEDRLPLQAWSVSRMVGGRQVFLTVTPNDLGLAAGSGLAWDDSLCQVMWEDEGPRIAPDVAAVEAYRDRGLVRELSVRSYVGIPLLLADGSLFGTVVGLDDSAQPDDLVRHRDLLELLGRVLTETLRADQLAMTLARQLEATRAAADTDPLTGLLNRRAWAAVCTVEQGRHHRLGDHASVIVVDLDGLKAVNDSAGHAAGDDLLRTTARVLRTTIRSGDHLARIGGDEFVVLCPQTTRDDAVHLADRLTVALAEAQVSASLGAGTMTQTTGMADAQDEADRRMYAVKRFRRAQRGEDAGPSGPAGADHDGRPATHPPGQSTSRAADT